MIRKIKAVFIGPVYPFRGGIAQYHTILANKVSTRHDITVISFKRLYPSFLYPGRSQKEENKSTHLSFKVDYSLDSIHPYSWYKAYKKIKEMNPEWVIFQWWHTFFAPCYATIAYLLKKNTPIKTGMAFHNFLPHDNASSIHLFLVKIAAKYIDHCIALYTSVADEIQETLPQKKCSVLLGPSCAEIIDSAAQKLSQKEARKKLNISGNVMLFFGFVRPYKGLNYVLDALALLKNAVDITLVIAGEFWSDKGAYLKKIEELGIKKNVIIRDEYIPSEEVPSYFTAADVVVIPYTAASDNSAVLNMALGLATPVIATRVGSNEELIDHNKNGYLIEPRNAPALARALTDFFKQNKAPLFRRALHQKIQKLAWSAEKERVLFDLD